MRIEYDDDALSIIDKVNKELKDNGVKFEFVDDNELHDGFELFELRSTSANT